MPVSVWGWWCEVGRVSVKSVGCVAPTLAAAVGETGVHTGSECGSGCHRCCCWKVWGGVWVYACSGVAVSWSRGRRVVGRRGGGGHCRWCCCCCCQSGSGCLTTLLGCPGPPWPLLLPQLGAAGQRTGSVWVRVPVNSVVCAGPPWLLLPPLVGPLDSVLAVCGSGCLTTP